MSVWEHVKSVSMGPPWPPEDKHARLCVLCSVQINVEQIASHLYTLISVRFQNIRMLIDEQIALEIALNRWKMWFYAAWSLYSLAKNTPREDLGETSVAKEARIRSVLAKTNRGRFPWQRSFHSPSLSSRKCNCIQRLPPGNSEADRLWVDQLRISKQLRIYVVRKTPSCDISW